MNGADAIDWQGLGTLEPVGRPTVSDATTCAIRGREVRAVRWVAGARGNGLLIEFSGGVRLFTQFDPPPRGPRDRRFALQAFYPKGHAEWIHVDDAVDDLPSWSPADPADDSPPRTDREGRPTLLAAGIAIAAILDGVLRGKVANLLHWLDPNDGMCDGSHRYDLEFTDATYLHFDLDAVPTARDPVPWVYVSDGG